MPSIISFKPVRDNGWAIPDESSKEELIRRTSTLAQTRILERFNMIEMVRTPGLSEPHIYVGNRHENALRSWSYREAKIQIPDLELLTQSFTKPANQESQPIPVPLKPSPEKRDTHYRGSSDAVSMMKEFRAMTEKISKTSANREARLLNLMEKLISRETVPVDPQNPPPSPTASSSEEEEMFVRRPPLLRRAHRPNSRNWARSSLRRKKKFKAPFKANEPKLSTSTPRKAGNAKEATPLFTSSPPSRVSPPNTNSFIFVTMPPVPRAEPRSRGAVRLT